MKSALLTKVFRFEAAHYLPGHQGKCAHLHGHSYRLEIPLRGPIRDTPEEFNYGKVMDFDDLSRIVHTSIIERLDHHMLNDVTGIHTTAENLSHWIWDNLVAVGLSDQNNFCKPQTSGEGESSPGGTLYTRWFR